MSDHDHAPSKLTRRNILLGSMAAMAAAAIPLPGCSKKEGGAEEPLLVGGLPVTCNLSLPVACAAREAALAAGTAKGAPYGYSKYNGWPELKESLMSGRIQAAYMLAPLVMDLAAKKIPVKVVALGHRSGSVIMVRTDSGYKTFKELSGKRVAIPSRFAVDFLYLRRMLAKEGMTEKDVQILEMPPPDMPAALYAKAVDAYCTGEPFGASAQKAGYAVPLSMTRDEWPNYICCVLTVREELIATKPALVQDLVNGVISAGAWLDADHQNRGKAVGIVATPKYFNQDKEILQFAMDNPADRITYGDLRLIKSEFEELMQLSIDAKTITSPVPYESYVDEQFAKAAQPATIAI